MTQTIEPLSLQTGGVLFKIQFRHSRGDEGLTFDVFPADGKNKDRLLRFDCFRDKPHFHLGRVKVMDIDKSRNPDPPRWALSQFKTRLSSLIEEAGYKDVAQQVNQAAVAKSLSRIEKEIFRLEDESK